SEEPDFASPASSGNGLWQTGVASLRAWAPVLVPVWITGSVLWFVLTGLRIRRFQRLLRFAEPAPVGLQDQTRRLSAQLSLGSCPQVFLIPGPVAPLVWAVGSPARLFFPSALLNRLDENGRATLIAHELAHLRRRDHWVRWLELIALGLYWWLPLVWWARQRLQAAEEECCDAWVVGELPAAARAYASALLETIAFLSRMQP